MDYKEKYKEDFKMAEVRAGIEKTRALYEFVDNTALYSIGDIIKNNTWTIIISKVSGKSNYGEVPSIYYMGQALNKNLTIKKNGAARYVEEGNDNSPIILISRGKNK